MINRFGTEVEHGDFVSFHPSRGDTRAGFIQKIFRISGYGWRIQTRAGSCGLDDVIKTTRNFIRAGCHIEIDTGSRAPGWEVLDPDTGLWCNPVRRADALRMVRNMRNEK